MRIIIINLFFLRIIIIITNYPYKKDSYILLIMIIIYFDTIQYFNKSKELQVLIQKKYSFCLFEQKHIAVSKKDRWDSTI